MAALLAGARLVLRQGVRLLPAYTRRPLPVRCLSGSSRLFTMVAQERGNAEAEPALADLIRPWQERFSIHLIGYKLKKYRRIPRYTLITSFEEVCKAGKLDSNQAWLFLHACGSFMPGVLPVERTVIVTNIWDKLKELGVDLSVTHYNTLLAVYLQNEHAFSPTEFLASMEEVNVEPNQDTYQGLIAAYCRDGDIDGASKILGFMKSKNFLITEEVFNSLIKGHARAGDMESAKNILPIMQSAGIEPQHSTYVALLTAYAEKGDIQNIRQILDDHEINVPQKLLTSVIFALSKSGHSQYVPDVLEHMPNCESFSQDVINLCMALITQGYEDAALQVAERLREWKPADKSSGAQSGDFFLSHCVNLNLPVDILNKCADKLLAAEMHTRPKEFMLQEALRTSNLDLSIKLMKSMNAEGMLLRGAQFRSFLVRSYERRHLPELIELMRHMKALGVYVESNVLSKCMNFIFSEANAGHPILQDKQCLEDLQNVCFSSVRWGLYSGSLDKVYKLLSSKTMPVSMCRGLFPALSAAFAKSKDVDTFAKITGLLYKDGPYSKDSPRQTEPFGYFLYYFIERMSLVEAQAMEEQLRQYFHRMKEMDMTLAKSWCRGIQRLLQRNGVPQLQEDLKELLNTSAPDLGAAAENIAVLEEELSTLERDSATIEPVLLKLLDYLYLTKELPKALQLKSDYEEVFTFDMYMKLLVICCEADNPQEALKLKKEIDQKEFATVLNTQGYIALLRVLTSNGLIEDAINILKEMEEKNVPTKESTSEDILEILNNLALKDDVQALNLFHEFTVMTGFIKPKSSFCAPLVNVHLKKKDLSAALDSLMECIEKYKCFPLVNELFFILVETGQTALLKEAVDRLSEHMGERAILHELFFAFMRAGKYSEAVKIVETPGLRAMQLKMNWFTSLCIRLNQVDLLEKCVELSEKLFDCNREHMYSQLFIIYDQNDDWEKAKIAYYKMKGENLVLDKKMWSVLKALFQRNEQDVYAHIPELQDITPPVRRSAKAIRGANLTEKIPEAFAQFREAEQNDITLQPQAYASLLKALNTQGLKKEAAEVRAAAKKRAPTGGANNLTEDEVRQGRLKDTVDSLQTMLEQGRAPSKFTVFRLISALALKGDVPGIETLKELLQCHASYYKKTKESLNTGVVLAHLKNGNFEEGISVLENICIVDPKEIHSLFLIDQLMSHQMDEAMEKVSILAEQLANQFGNYSLITDLFLNYIKAGKSEEANHLLQRNNAIVEQRSKLNRYIINQCKRDQEILATQLVEMLSDPYYKEVLYNVKMTIFVSKQDVDGAVSLYEKTKAEHIDPDELFLKQLAGLLRGAGKPVPFSEPPETIEYYKAKQKKPFSEDDAELQKEE